MARRELLIYKNYFKPFYDGLSVKVKNKIIWTFDLIKVVDRIPEVYMKHLVNTDGLYEIRVQHGNNIYRIFCFFDSNNLIVVGHGFQKKTQKTPIGEIAKAEKIKKTYYDEKSGNPGSV